MWSLLWGKEVLASTNIHFQTWHWYYWLLEWVCAPMCECIWAYYVWMCVCVSVMWKAGRGWHKYFYHGGLKEGFALNLGSCRKYPMWRWRWYSGGERKPGQQTGLTLNQAVVFSFFYQFQVHKGLCELFSHSFITFKRILPSVTH